MSNLSSGHLPHSIAKGMNGVKMNRQRSCCTHSSFTPSTTTIKKSLTIPEDDEITTRSHKSQQNGRWSVDWQCSSKHTSSGKGKKVINLERRRSVDRYHECRSIAPETTNCSPGQGFYSESEEDSSSEEEIDAMILDNIDHSCYSHAYLRRCYSQHKDRNRGRKSVRHSSTSLRDKYQPKSFQDIVGHEIITKVISNAVDKKKIAQLYLFHGPNGTGKTSTARIFAMALQCESPHSFNKPCWSCRGCSRSPSVMKLCSGSRASGFQRISILLQNTSFIQAPPTIKVFIIEESHNLAAEAWDQLLDIVENMQSAAVVFVLITVDASTIPISISSRCQKFFFPRLKDADVMLKLAGIVVQEDIGIEEEALKLIIMKAEGSLREAEHLLDQLNLPGLRITSSMVQQFVGLVPLNKLINLLTIALSGDTEKTLLSTTRELIATGVEAQTLAFQLATLIADLLSEASATTPNYSTLVGPSSEKKRLLTSKLQHTNVQPERLCHTLKILIDAKKQPRSSIDNITQIYAALLQIAPQNNSSGTSSGFSLPNGIIIPTGETTQLENHHCMSKTSEHSTVDRISIKTFSKSKQSRTVECIEKTMKCRGIDVDEGLNLARWTDMEETWLHILDNIQSIDMKEFLSSHVKLASVTLTCAANAIVHLVFKTPEDKLAAQISEESISEALKSSIGCPVIINMSLEPLDMGFVQECNASNNKSKLEESNYSMQMQQKLFLPELVDVTNPRVRMHQNKHVKPASPSDNKPRPTELKDSMSISQEEDGSPTREAKLTRCLRGQMSPFFGLIMQDNQLEASTSAATNSLIRDQGKANTSHVMITERPKHRWLSLSSIQQSDASVQPYSQDILFENANIDRESRTNKNPKLQKDSSKVHKELHLQERAKSMRLFRSWSCKELLGQTDKSKNLAA